jgi:hypothetical protein
LWLLRLLELLLLLLVLGEQLLQSGKPTWSGKCGLQCCVGTDRKGAAR